MTAVAHGRYRTLGVHLTARGFGWVLCEGPFILVQSGVFTALHGNKNASCRVKVEKLIARHKPREFVIEDCAGNARRHPRIKQLCIDLLTTAAERGLYIASYPREAVQDAFSAIGARTREEVAEAVARFYPALALRLPPPRKPWNSEDKRLAIFAAAAAVLAHFHNGATALLNDVRNAA
jgi:Holliday junction resolvasome RuvABC endonuclease subunit